MITLPSIVGHTSIESALKHALKVVSFYEFVPFEEAPTGEQAVVSGRVMRFDAKDILFSRREERRLIPAMRMCIMRGLGDRRTPALLWKISPGERGTDQVVLELHAIGMKTAAAEALLITVADAIAADLGITDRLIHINSLGVGESSERYLRELTSFLRKHAADLSNAQRERMTSDPVGAFLSFASKGALPSRVPSSMDYLSDEERKHFWDVLEYLELAEKTYELSPLVVGSGDCWARTIFEISRPGEQGRIPFAFGGRYDALAAKCINPAAAGVHVGIVFESPTMPVVKHIVTKPNIYFAHLGVEAKRRSIPVLEMLRMAHIPVHHSLAFDQLGPQMATVKQLNLPWLVIMGQKEVREGSALVRNTKSNAQVSIPIEGLAEYLRRKKAVV
ncbi:MAG: His/Gly/Thr/Pro-type tRNA ligase C-terminal domain-containing protein [Patescibacteria group bacterium]